ncbi:MAG: archaemetzincin family Zn-dependent metalloprotease [Candidatus Loosdrechtia sp.]|uniref:archaemetzincin family Zn-dependent metalloprotease n=1 Tax=Candidatus Loosdrechtia sp. TaxID=3101272 RepID=UPI003A794E80|nr:MAG: archaemetzincin family Zn-dependent metalloprotease [Candidatus Jettenia sp. AMX2]
MDMKPITVLFLSIIPFGSIPKNVSDHLQVELSGRFGLKVRIGKVQPVPRYAFNPGRNQYHSTEILKRLKQIRTKEELILGVIDADLFVPELNFIFGEADTVDGVCIISFTRLRQEYYGLPKNEKLFLERSAKEAIHEIGHTYRLGHCEDRKCIMHFSNSLKDTDIKGPGFCKKCKMQLNQFLLEN